VRFGSLCGDPTNQFSGQVRALYEQFQVLMKLALLHVNDIDALLEFIHLGAGSDRSAG
jgi:hypothetical protein